VPVETNGPQSSSEAIGQLWEGFAQFGADWWYVAAIAIVGLLAGAVITSRGHTLDAGEDGGSREGEGEPSALIRLVERFGTGAARLTGLPAWSAAGLLLLLGTLVVAYGGFFWDVAWHIDIGRDEFLFSPPHVHLLVGLSGLGVTGAVSTVLATRMRADVGWRVRRWTVPLGAAGLLAAGGLAMAGYWIDEAWHAVYGLDVTMWSPPHLTMISSAVFSPLAGWLLLAEAGKGAGNRLVRRHLRPLLAGVVLVALSAWQLEFDLGVPFWQQAFQPILMASAAGFALTMARAIGGPGTALLALGHFLVVRAIGAVATAGMWGLSMPRFPLYLGAAIAVELAFRFTRGREPLPRFLVAGAGVATLGLAEMWAFSQVWAHHPWQTRLLPAMGLAALAAVAAAVLGGAFGRIVDHRPAGFGRVPVLLAFAALLVTVVVPLPRATPDAEVRVETSAAGEGFVNVVVTVDPPSAVDRADRWEVFAWQGLGRANEPLVAVGDGRYVTENPVPVGGTWKTMIRVADGRFLGAVPIALPADPEYDQPPIPLQDVREQPFQFQNELMLREQQEGPAWPSIVGGLLIAGMIAGLLGTVIGGTVALDRRRREGDDRRPDGGDRRPDPGGRAAAGDVATARSAAARSSATSTPSAMSAPPATPAASVRSSETHP
jgi:hypothetical protein